MIGTTERRERVTMDLERIEYRSGMLARRAKPESLPVRAWSGTDIPTEVREAAEQEGLRELGGVYGDRNVGDPVQYDHLKLWFGDKIVEITVLNRGIMLLFGDDERLRRIHRLACRLCDPEPSR